MGSDRLRTVKKSEFKWACLNEIKGIHIDWKGLALSPQKSSYPVMLRPYLVVTPGNRLSLVTCKLILDFHTAIRMPVGVVFMRFDLQEPRRLHFIGIFVMAA